MRYRALDPASIIQTAETLEQRVAERFPDAGLRNVAAELVSLSRDIAVAARALEAPVRWLRFLIGGVLALGLIILVFVAASLSYDRISTGAFDFVQGVEASMNTLLLAGLGLLALVRMEERIKRKRVFAGLHGLRSVIHVIDMHQLTKDPATLSSPLKPTAHSPRRTLSPAELSRYLDYCSEMLSLTGKLAAHYAKSVNDNVVVDAVNDIESLSSNLSRKIWQKIVMIEGQSGKTGGGV